MDDVNPLAFYSQPGVMTDPGEHARLLEGLPTDIPGLCRAVQNNLVHVFWAERMGLKLTEDQRQALYIRPIDQKLAIIRKTSEQPLSVPRPLERRQVGNCRDFSLLLCTMLRHRGTPARARCGFGAYFMPGHYEDHWICEHWNAEEGRWIMVDPQLDQFQMRALDIQFDPTDVPGDAFITAGRAWEMCRSGRADPNLFGIFDMHGTWFIWGNVIRDFLALNKVEILPWDGGWGFLTHTLTDPVPDNDTKEERILPRLRPIDTSMDSLPGNAPLTVYDHIAALTVAADDKFTEIRSFHDKEPRFRIPDEWGLR